MMTGHRVLAVISIHCQIQSGFLGILMARCVRLLRILLFYIEEPSAFLKGLPLMPVL